MPTIPNANPAMSELDRHRIANEAKARSPREAADMLAEYPAAQIAEVLQELNPALTADVLAELPGGLVDGIMHVAPTQLAAQWRTNQQYGEGTIGRMMEPARAVFRPDMTVRDTIEQLRPLIRSVFITYGYVTDDAGKLLALQSKAGANSQAPGDEEKQPETSQPDTQPAPQPEKQTEPTSPTSPSPPEQSTPEAKPQSENPDSKKSGEPASEGSKQTNSNTSDK